MKKYIIYALVILVCFLSLKIFFQYREIQSQNVLLNSDIIKIKLEKDILEGRLKAALIKDGNEVTYIYKDKIVTKTVTVEVYVPPETIYVVRIVTDNSIVIDYNDKGFTFFPWVGLAYDSKLSPQLGARLFYWNRFGGGLYTDFDGFGACIDYRIDGYVNWISNSAISAGYKNGKGNLGVHVFF